MRRTLVIGDLHGHIERLEVLLDHCGLLDACPACTGGRVDEDICAQCGGLAKVRMDREGTEVVLLGDIGDFGSRHGSPTGDALCVAAAEHWADVALWGNHDRAVIEAAHVFGGFRPPAARVFAHLWRLRAHGQIRLAHAAHGTLLTHAGLGELAWSMLPEDIQEDPAAVAEALCALEHADDTDPLVLLRDAVGRDRGGLANGGGIIWRDWGEPIADAFAQVCGHSRDLAVRRITLEHTHLCVDVADPTNGRLAGVWLPDGELVEVCVDGTTTHVRTGDAVIDG